LRLTDFEVGRILGRLSSVLRVLSGLCVERFLEKT